MSIEPRVILETDLHNDCGLIAAAALKYLTSHGVKAKILRYGHGKDKGHRLVIFESGGSLAAYDHQGTRTIHRATWKTPPKAFAKAIMDAERDERKVTMAKWE